MLYLLKIVTKKVQVTHHSIYGWSFVSRKRFCQLNHMRQVGIHLIKEIEFVHSGDDIGQIVLVVCSSTFLDVRQCLSHLQDRLDHHGLAVPPRADWRNDLGKFFALKAKKNNILVHFITYRF